MIVKLKMDKNRKGILERRAKGRLAKTGDLKGKYTEDDRSPMIPADAIPVGV